MFYYKNWETFCAKVKYLNVEAIRARDVSEKYKTTQFIVFKHDVETNPSKALKLAQIENKYDINGSFYVQEYLLNNPSNVKILQEIRDLGHEVSYHYDVLDVNDGDFKKAKTEFQTNLEKFISNGFRIETVCQHGNPIKIRVGYTSNRDFFRNESIAQQYNDITDIVVNFKEKTGTKFLYISDAGYSWNIISDPENNDRVNEVPDVPLNGLNNVLDLLQKGNSIILSTHPHRWKKSKVTIHFKIRLFKTVRFFVRLISRVPVFKNVLSRFYFLAKKI